MDKFQNRPTAEQLLVDAQKFSRYLYRRDIDTRRQNCTRIVLFCSELKNQLGATLCSNLLHILSTGTIACIQGQRGNIAHERNF